MIVRLSGCPAGWLALQIASPPGTGGALARACHRYNGTDCDVELRAGYYLDFDLTDINSITLQP